VTTSSVTPASVPSGLIGVVHLQAMPGDPGYEAYDGDASSGFESVERAALRDADALLEGGVDAIIVENFGSTPFSRGDSGSRLPPHQVALLALVVRAIRAMSSVPVGVNCLRNDAMSALGIAAATGADFIRVNVHVGAYVTDQGVVEGEAHATMRYRDQLGMRRHIAVLADVLVKHAEPLAPLAPARATLDALERGRADAVIVTGSATGGPVDAATLREVARAAGDAPVLLGSGVTPSTAPDLAPLAHAAIVGTWLKRDGLVSNPVDVARVRAIVEALAGVWGREG